MKQYKKRPYKKNEENKYMLGGKLFKNRIAIRTYSTKILSDMGPIESMKMEYPDHFAFFMSLFTSYPKPEIRTYLDRCVDISIFVDIYKVFTLMMLLNDGIYHRLPWKACLTFKGTSQRINYLAPS